MQLGKTFVGAIIGGALSIGLLLVVYHLFRIDQAWLSIFVAILTGLGVRMMVSTTGHASYLRGAITAVLALAVYLGGWYIVAKVATARASAGQSSNTLKDGPAKPAAEDEDADEKDDEVAAAAEPPKAVAPRAGAPATHKAPPRKDFSPLEWISLCVAALIAYNLGRGSDAAPVATAPPAEPMPGGTHPDA